MSKTALVQVVISALCSVGLLAPVPERLLHPGPWLGFVAGLVTLMTQPALSPGQVVGDRTDRASALAIFLAGVGSQVTSMLDYGYRPLPTPPAVSGAVAVGTIAVVLGLALRLWAIRTLGDYFTSTVHVAEGQNVVDRGPYRLLRHPSYTGTIVHWIGLSIALASWLGFTLVLLLVVPAYSYRMAVEERVLGAELGAAYEAYRERTWRLIPFIY